MSWLAGLFVSIVLGHLVIWPVHYFTYSHLHVPKPVGPGIPSWVIGVLERAFFTVVFAYGISGGAVSMLAWIALKMVTGWNRPGQMAEGEDILRSRQAFAAIFVGLWSMAFALIGGLICNRGFPIN